MADIVSIRHEGELLALIVPADYRADGIQFFTPGTFSQQLGYMNHPQGHEILPHDHNPVPRTVEMIEVKQGPYAGEQDKERFAAISTDQIRITG